MCEHSRVYLEKLKGYSERMPSEKTGSSCGLAFASDVRIVAFTSCFTLVAAVLSTFGKLASLLVFSFLIYKMEIIINATWGSGAGQVK